MLSFTGGLKVMVALEACDYRVEAGLRDQRTSAKLRAVARGHQSRPIVARIKKILLAWKVRHRFLPKSTMGAAIDYTLGQMPHLQTYLDDGRVEIDNNMVENAINPFDYLRDVLTRLPSMTNWQIKDITPAAWAAAQQSVPLHRAA